MKKIMTVSLLLVVIGIVFAADPTSVGEGQNIRFANASQIDASNVDDTFVNQIPDPAEPGTIIELRWKLENFGGADVEDVVVQLDPEFPFSLPANDDGRRTVSSIHTRQIGKEGIIVFYRVIVDEDAIEGNSPIRLRYSLDNGRSWIQLSPYLVRIQTHDAILSIVSVDSKPKELRPGSTADVSVRFRNYADSLIKDVQFMLQLAGTKISPVGSSGEKIIEQISGNKESSINFKLVADADAESKVHQIPYSLVYLDNLGTKYTRNGTIGLPVNDAPQFDINLEEVEVYTAKQKGKVVVSISNTGSSEIRFMNLGLNPSPEYEIISSPKVYIGNVESDDFETAEFEIFVNSKADNVPLSIRLEYKNSYNKAFVQDQQLVLDLYSRSEAQKLGLIPTGSAGGAFFGFVILVITTVFWIFMLVDVRQTKMVRYRKWLWFSLVLLTHVVGAVIYYFLGKKKELGRR